MSAPETQGDRSISAVEGSWYDRWLPRTILALPVAASVTALVQTYGVYHEVIKSSTFHDPDEYEAEMLAITEQEAQARADKAGRWSRPRSSDSNNE